MIKILPAAVEPVALRRRRAQLPIEILVLLCASIPAELACSLDPAGAICLCVGKYREDAGGNSHDARGIEKMRRVAAYLWKCAGVGSCDRATGSHGLERWLAEPLVEARKHQRRCSSIEIRKLQVGHVAPAIDTGSLRSIVMSASREYESELWSLLFDQGERVEQACMILVRPGVGGI